MDIKQELAIIGSEIDKLDEKAQKQTIEIKAQRFYNYSKQIELKGKLHPKICPFEQLTEDDKKSYAKKYDEHRSKVDAPFTKEDEILNTLNSIVSTLDILYDKISSVDYYKNIARMVAVDVMKVKMLSECSDCLSIGRRCRTHQPIRCKGSSYECSHTGSGCYECETAYSILSCPTCSIGGSECLNREHKQWLTRHRIHGANPNDPATIKHFKERLLDKFDEQYVHWRRKGVRADMCMLFTS